jgi:hypothetical protein
MEKNKMKIIYRDDLGYSVVTVDCDIVFDNGFAIFDVNDAEQKIPITQIYMITTE